MSGYRKRRSAKRLLTHSFIACGIRRQRFYLQEGRREIDDIPSRLIGDEKGEKGTRHWVGVDK